MKFLVLIAAVLCGGNLVNSLDNLSHLSPQEVERLDERPKRLIPFTTYYMTERNYDPLLRNEYLRQQSALIQQQQRQQQQPVYAEQQQQVYSTQQQQVYSAEQPQQNQNNYYGKMIQSGYSFTNGENEQFYKQYLPEAASSFEQPTYIKYVQVAENSSPKPSPLPKYKPIQKDYILPTASSGTKIQHESPTNNQYVLVHDGFQYYYQPATNVQPQTNQQTIYNRVQATQDAESGYISEQQYSTAIPNPTLQPPDTRTEQQRVQYQSVPNPNPFQQYFLETTKQQIGHPEREYLPLTDEEQSIRNKGQLPQMQYQSPVAGQYQSETYSTTSTPLTQHRFASIKQQSNSQVPQHTTEELPHITSVTIEKSHELPVNTIYSESFDSQREKLPSRVTPKPTKLQKVEPTYNPNYGSTDRYYPQDQPLVQYTQQPSKPTPFHLTHSTTAPNKAYYLLSTTTPRTQLYITSDKSPIKSQQSLANEQFQVPVQNVRVTSPSYDENNQQSTPQSPLPYSFLNNFKLQQTNENYEIPLTSFTGPAKANSFSTTKKPTISHTKPNSFYEPYLKLIKNNVNKINPAQYFNTQRPVAQSVRPISQTTSSSLLPSHEEQKYKQNLGVLSQILKGYNINKELPEKVTADNIDSSIDTLTTILKVLQKNQGVPPLHPNQHLPFTSLPDNTLTQPPTYTKPKDSSTPGRPGIDYPTYSQIPETEFDCKTQRYKGFFGDPETNCQVWHYCDLNGGQASFLCPNGTIFNQVALTCDWWFNVKCNSTAQLYVLNERLYKYIIPTKPSFPEDYSGPAVDEYLKKKYYELEAKRKPSSDDDSSTEYIKPGTTTEPVQSNELEDNYLRRSIVSSVSRPWR